MAKLTIVVFLYQIVQIALMSNSDLPRRERLVDDFRPPSVPLIVVDPYFRLSRVCHVTSDAKLIQQRISYTLSVD